MKEKIIFRSNFIIDCRIFDGCRRKKFSISSIQNLNMKYTKGDISASAKKKILKIAETYLTAISIENTRLNRLGQKPVRMPVFITLTYPASPTQDDNTLKRRHLGEFVKWLTRTKKCAGYLWRAETQKNGNLHFHIFSDKYIHHLDIRTVWNSILGKDGYIETFYEKHGHTNPNSTDIEAVKNIAKATAYIAKYITKSADSKARKQQGRVYGMSDNLRKIVPYSEEGFDRMSALSAIENTNGIKSEKKISDWVSVYELNDSTAKILYRAGNNMFKEYENYYQNVAKVIGL